MLYKSELVSAEHDSNGNMIHYTDHYKDRYGNEYWNARELMPLLE